MNQNELEEFIKIWHTYQGDWNKFARDIFRVRLDKKQQEILYAIQENRLISIRSGHARGKDFLAAVASLCFLYLFTPSKVISTAPTGHQVDSIMMSEISKIHSQAVVPMPGIVLSRRIKFPGEENADWFLEGFKARDKAVEAWSGRHSPNLFVVVTEASGLEDLAFSAIEGILTGRNPKLLIVFNPHRKKGIAYKSTKSARYKKFDLSCLNAPNVKAKKELIPGQVDYEWVKDKIDRWCKEIEKDEFQKDIYDFEFEEKYYRPCDPNDDFLVKVLGEFPREDEGSVIPLIWCEKAVERWHELRDKINTKEIPCRWGVDVAGMGRDNTIYAPRYNNFVDKLIIEISNDHMVVAGKIKNFLTDTSREVEDEAFIDAIGEGAGVYSRCREQKLRVTACKGSMSGKGFRDYTQQRTFANMRAYTWWAVRDALNPKGEFNLAIPPDDLLVEELTEPTFEYRSNGTIMIKEDNTEIAESLGRSPDRADALRNTFWPSLRFEVA